MKTIVFDSGPIISLTMNNLLWILEPLKKAGKCRLVMPDLVKKELVDTPLSKTKRFMFEALQVESIIERGTLEVVHEPAIRNVTGHLMSLANDSYRAFGHNMRLIHDAEMAAVALYLHLKADAFVVDERTTRQMIENPKKLLNTLKHKFNTSVSQNNNYLNQFRKLTRNVNIIRSVELVTIAYEKKMLDRYLSNIPHAKKKLLESVLWGVKLNGCSVSKREIQEIMRIEAKN